MRPSLLKHPPHAQAPRGAAFLPAKKSASKSNLAFPFVLAELASQEASLVLLSPGPFCYTPPPPGSCPAVWLTEVVHWGGGRIPARRSIVYCWSNQCPRTHPSQPVFPRSDPAWVQPQSQRESEPKPHSECQPQLKPQSLPGAFLQSRSLGLYRELFAPNVFPKTFNKCLEGTPRHPPVHNPPKRGGGGCCVFLDLGECFFYPLSIIASQHHLGEGPPRPAPFPPRAPLSPGGQRIAAALGDSHFYSMSFLVGKITPAYGHDTSTGSSFLAPSFIQPPSNLPNFLVHLYDRLLVG